MSSKSIIKFLALFLITSTGGVFAMDNPLGADSISDITLHEVRVSARPLALTGLTRFSIDSLSLHRNPAASLADAISLQPSVFVKTSGRASLSTVSIRGTSPSHTLVEWNGLDLNSPMLGMTDFSLIPTWLVDRAEVFYGPSSIQSGSGGLGGAINLSTSVADIPRGWSGRVITGFGSFTSFDEFASLAFRSRNFTSVTRVAFSSSRNDFTYINHNKKLNIYDDNHNIVSQYYPREKNENGAFRDFHLLQQLAWVVDECNSLEANLWWLNSRRQLPLTTVDYSSTSRYQNIQYENTLRGHLQWIHRGPLKSTASIGIVRSGSKYLYGLDNGSGSFNRLTDAHTHTTSVSARWLGDLLLGNSSSLSFSAKAWLDDVSSYDFASLAGPVGYDRSRFNAEAMASWRYRLSPRTAFSLTLREELHGSRATLPIVALHAQHLLHAPSSLWFNISASRNESTPSLNDLFYVPGGNPDLRSEKAWNYDVGFTLGLPLSSRFTLDASATCHDSYISDWILWLPTPKGFFSPGNVKSVHSYGIEITASPRFIISSTSAIRLQASYSFTPSINTSRSDNSADKSYGKQLPYIPRHTSSFTISYTLGLWEATLSALYYSRRFTMSSNDSAITGSVDPYFIADATIQRSFPIRTTQLSLKLTLNNLFNADYVTILTHPMPGFNTTLHLSLSF